MSFQHNAIPTQQHSDKILLLAFPQTIIIFFVLSFDNLEPATATPEVRLTADTGQSVANNQPSADDTGSLEQGIRTLVPNSSEQSPGQSPVDSLQWTVSSGQSPVDSLQWTVSS